MSKYTNMMGQVKKLKNGVGVQSLLDEAYKILGNPIVMFNTEYNLLAYTEAASDDPIWNEIVTSGTFSKETQRFFENEGFIEEVANSSRITFMKSNKLKYDRIGGKVVNKNDTYVANLVLVASNKPFHESDPMVFEGICTLISKEISRSEVYQEYEQTHQERIIGNLINGNYDIKLEIAQVGIIYDSLKSNLYIAVVDISECNPQYTDIAYFRDLLKQIEPTYKYAVYSNYIIIIISTNDEFLDAKKSLSELNEVFEQNNMYVGISGKFENLFELQKYYMEALNAMQHVLEIKCNQQIFPYIESSMDKMRQIKALESGLGIQYYLDAAPKIFGNPVLFHDMEHNLLAYSENVEISDPIWQELITYGTCSNETINIYKTEGFISAMENTRGGAFLISKKIKNDRISWRIYSNDNIMIGYLSTVNSIKPFTEDELVLFGAFCQMFSKEVGKIEFYNNYAQVYSETVINRLISGKIDDYTFYSRDIGNLCNNLMDNLYLVVLDTSHCESGQVSLTYIRELFDWPDTVNRYAIYTDYIVIIMSSDSKPLNGKNKFEGINRIFEQNNIYAGVSRRMENIYEMQKYYLEAFSALNSGIKNEKHYSKQRIFHYNGRDCAS